MKKKLTKPETPEGANGALPSTLRIGISRCLLGDEVRFDGGHKRDRFLTDTFSQFVEWVPVCPEYEAGLGIPREAMRLVGSSSDPTLLTIKTKKDHTSLLKKYSQKKVQELGTMNLDGFVFKKDSPSCGVHRVRIYNDHGMPNPHGRGLFAQRFIENNPLIPVEEDGRLNDPILRENFVERVFCYQRWRLLNQTRVSRRALIDFHTRHKFLLLAHGRTHYQKLGQLVANSKKYSPSELMAEYGTLFMEALKVKVTTRKHVDVLQHLAGFLKKELSREERQELVEVIEDYHRGLTPLIVPLTLIVHYVRIHQISYLLDQVYLTPHPKELMLRNHV
ncbi:MAG: DUF523 and DUF1722 domain-containing protein [Nitrospirae bacterium]|nr:DUF523 and DUF1722 domain-containing protein [Nitrospirota bacterium]MDA1304451.1 DUF523 and DUF1722 domain-containing protein [Nitrospirota bacterium]